MPEKKERQVFKIWDLKNKKYVTGDKSKTTWRSLKWVTNKIQDLCNTNTYYHSSDGSRKASEFEIRIFELQLIDSYSAEELHSDAEKRAKLKRLCEEEIGLMESKVKAILPSLSLHQIKNLYRTGALSEDVAARLVPLMNNIKKSTEKLKSL